MELASFVPTELSNSAAPAGRATPDSATSADDATALPISFAQLLQTTLTAPPGGDGLPQCGNDLPAESDSAEDAGSGLGLLEPAFALLNPLAAPVVTAQATLAPGTAAGTPPLPAGVNAPPLGAAARAVAPDGTDAFAAAQSAAANPSAVAVADGAAAFDAAESDVAPALTPSADAERNANAPPLAAPEAQAARAAALAAAQRDDAAAGQPAAAPLTAMPAGQPAGDSPPGRPRGQVRGTERSLGSVISGDAQSAAAGARAVAITAQAADAAAAAAAAAAESGNSADSQLGSPLSAPALAGLAAQGGEGAAGQSFAASHSFAHSIGAAAATAPATGAATAAAATGFGQGANQALDTTSSGWNDALAGRIHWLVDHDVGEARIKLHPPELGPLDVKISLVDDKTFVQLAAHSSAARDELAQSLPRLRELLTASGLQLGGATVSDGRDQQPARNAQADAGGGVPRGFAALADSSDAQVRATRRALSQIDLFA